MKEFINCGGCNATISTDNYKCDFCGLVIKDDSKNRELMRFIENFDLKFLEIDDFILLKEIENSNFKNTVYAKYRVLKIQLLIELKTGNNIDANKMNFLLEELVSLSSENSEYLKDFVVFFSALSNTFNNGISIETYNLIIQKLIIYKKEEFIIIESSLKKSLLNYYIGEKLISDYLFYCDKNNYIDDIKYLEKKNYIEEKYLTAQKKILEKIDRFYIT